MFKRIVHFAPNGANHSLMALGLQTCCSSGAKISALSTVSKGSSQNSPLLLKVTDCHKSDPSGVKSTEPA